MKKVLMVAALALATTSPSFAYETDDYGFPVQRSSVSRRSTSSFRSFARPVRVQPRAFSTRTSTAPVVASRVIRTAPVATVAPVRSSVERITILPSNLRVRR